MAAKSMIHVIIIVYVEKVFSAFTAYHIIFLILRFSKIYVPYAKLFLFSEIYLNIYKNY